MRGSNGCFTYWICPTAGDLHGMLSSPGGPVDLMCVVAESLKALGSIGPEIFFRSGSGHFRVPEGFGRRFARKTVPLFSIPRFHLPVSINAICIHICPHGSNVSWHFLQSDCEGMGPRVEPSAFSLNRIRSICKQESSMKVSPISSIRDPICTGPIQRRTPPPQAAA